MTISVRAGVIALCSGVFHMLPASQGNIICVFQISHLKNSVTEDFQTQIISVLCRRGNDNEHLFARE